MNKEYDMCPSCFCDLQQYSLRSKVDISIVICKNCRRRIIRANKIDKRVSTIIIENRDLLPLKQLPPEKWIAKGKKDRTLHRTKLDYGITMQDAIGTQVGNQ